MLKLGILGHPLSHSRSPEMQRAGLKYLGLTGSYDKFELRQEDFDSELPKIFSTLSGLNVTIPYKEKILNYLNMRDKLVERIGAANTLMISEGMIKGYNTDYQGFTDSLSHCKLKDKQIALLGAGGAARAIIIALEDMEPTEIDIYVRNFQKYDGQLPLVSKTNTKLHLYDENSDLSKADLVINCTPMGQGRLADEMPLNSEQIASLKESAIVYDLIYSDTSLLRAARNRGLTTIDGSRMLIMQGAHSLKIWTGKAVSEGLIEAMSGAFYAAMT